MRELILRVVIAVAALAGPLAVGYVLSFNEPGWLLPSSFLLSTAAGLTAIIKVLQLRVWRAILCSLLYLTLMFTAFVYLAVAAAYR